MDCPAVPDWTDGSSVVKTAHLSPRIGCRQLEIGTALHWADGTPSSQNIDEKRWFIFTEKIGFACGELLDKTEIWTLRIEVGTDDILRISGVERANGTTDWHLAVNYLTGDGYVDARDPYNTSWGSAIPHAEVERWGQAAMSAVVTNLNLKKSDGSWVLWPDQTCEQHYVDPAFGAAWDYDRNSATSFDIDSDGATPCP
jgi:hypothetical protein